MARSKATVDPRRVCVDLVLGSSRSRACATLIGWGGAKAAQVALCTAGPAAALLDPQTVLEENGRESPSPLEPLLVSEPLSIGGSLVIARVQRSAFRRSPWPYGRIAAGAEMSPERIAPGSRVFVPSTSGAEKAALLLEYTVAGTSDGALLVNSGRAHPPAGLPVFAERRMARDMVLIGVTTGAVDDNNGTFEVAHADAIRNGIAAVKAQAARGHSGRGLDAAVTAYIAECKQSGRLSAATIEARRHDLTQLARWADARQLGMESLTLADVSRYLAERSSEGASARTIARALGSSKQFLSSRGSVGLGAGVALRPGRVTSGPARRARALLTDDEVRLLVEAAAAKTTTGLRDRAMLEVLHATGVKPREIASLRVGDVDLKKGTIALHGRRHGRTSLVLTKSARAALRAHLGSGERAAEDRLFTTNARRALPYTAVGAIVQRYGELAGLHHRLTGSTLRNSLAHARLASGWSRKDVAEWLGLGKESDLAEYLRDPARLDG
jgi:site-specific recombinase XerD